MIKNVLQQAKQQQQQQQHSIANAAGKNHFLLLPYEGEKRGHLIIGSMKRRISKLLPPKIKTQVAYASENLSTGFNVRPK